MSTMRPSHVSIILVHGVSKDQASLGKYGVHMKERCAQALSIIQLIENGV